MTFPFLGSKRTLAPLYPAPIFPAIVEPFAGSAGYACLYPHLDVTLVDVDPDICGLWRYLIATTSERILELPILTWGDKPRRLSTLCVEEQNLLAMFNQRARRGPSAVVQIRRNDWRRGRVRVAELVGRIAHWQVIEGTYDAAPDVRASWFVDPPYQGAVGNEYVHGSAALDFDRLAEWVRVRQGQVIVCEAEGATWLPFRPIADVKNNRNRAYREMVHLRGPQKPWHVEASR